MDDVFRFLLRGAAFAWGMRFVASATSGSSPPRAQGAPTPAPWAELPYDQQVAFIHDALCQASERYIQAGEPDGMCFWCGEPHWTSRCPGHLGPWGLAQEYLTQGTLYGKRR